MPAWAGLHFLASWSDETRAAPCRLNATLREYFCLSRAVRCCSMQASCMQPKQRTERHPACPGVRALSGAFTFSLACSSSDLPNFFASTKFFACLDLLESKELFEATEMVQNATFCAQLP